ncbi:MAG: hypothetical protein J6A38_01165 [Clostridia bacterium]|nr:hypothetical protein [Clostridia bacterium]
MDKINEKKVSQFLNYAYHYKFNNPSSDWGNFFNSQYKNNTSLTNLEYFAEQQFSSSALKFLIPKIARLFDYYDIDGMIVFLECSDFDLSEIQDEIKYRVKQSKKDKNLHTIEQLIKLLIELEE